MSRHSILSSLFADDPFFSQDRLLWPLPSDALSSLQQDFINRRAKLSGSLFKELNDVPHLLQLDQLPMISSAFPSMSNGEPHREVSSVDPQKEVQRASENNGDLLVTLDARGYAPSDIKVKLEGRSLAVVAMKQAGAEESESCSSSTSSAAFRSAASARRGFVQKIDLPPHLDLSGLSCSLMDGGQLRIHAPAVKQPIIEEQQDQQEQQEPARFRTSLEFPIKKD